MGALTEEGRMSGPATTGNFVLFFEEKEGSTAVIQILSELDQVSVVRRETMSGLGGWEPFEWFNCGSLSPDHFRRCLQLIFGQRPVDLAALNSVYTRTARAPLRPFDASRSVGFKMRINPPWDIPRLTAASPLRRLAAVDYLARFLRRAGRNSFKNLMGRACSDLGVVVLVMVRQDIFRWAISKYHGDGTGRPGHLQFRLASGEVEAGGLPMITIDPQKFGRIVDRCVELHKVKRWWADAMRDAGVTVHALRYEEFLSDRIAFFSALLRTLGIRLGDGELDDRLSRQIRLQRVHGSDISEYVSNHREITDRYGGRFIAW
jgi:hypothetical protein